MNDVDIIAEQHPLELIGTNHYQTNDDDNDTISTFIPRLAEPIIIRGAGHITVFALNNKFDEEYPQDKVLDWENIRLYHKIGLHWHLTKQKCSNSAVQEYVLMIEFRAPLSLSDPD
ncbi:unnamed protein product [Rotaria sp. Silwood2]|nr:unnamed protein product [Rotaria sp. Silwood2]